MSCRVRARVRVRTLGFPFERKLLAQQRTAQAASPFLPGAEAPAHGAQRKPQADSRPASPGLQSGEAQVGNALLWFLLRELTLPARRLQEKRLLLHWCGSTQSPTACRPPPTKVGGSPSASVSTLSRIQRAASLNSRSAGSTDVCFFCWTPGADAPGSPFLRIGVHFCIGAEAPRATAHGASRKPILARCGSTSARRTAQAASRLAATEAAGSPVRNACGTAYRAPDCQAAFPGRGAGVSLP